MSRLIISIVCILALMGCNNPKEEKTIFSRDGRVVSEHPFEVIKVTNDGDAIAKEFASGSKTTHTDLEVLFLKKGGEVYYDHQIINLSWGEYVVQIGSYRYEDLNLYMLYEKGKKVKVEKNIPIVSCIFLSMQSQS